MKFNQSFAVKLNEKREQEKQKNSLVYMDVCYCILCTFMYILQSKFENFIKDVLTFAF